MPVETVTVALMDALDELQSWELLYAKSRENIQTMLTMQTSAQPILLLIPWM